MIAVFSSLTGIHFQVFKDDLCIAIGWKEHVELPSEVFDLLIDANLRLKASECIFGFSSVIFLGHRLSRDGISADPAKLEAIAELPLPKNSDEVRHVLGLLGYYCRLVPSFASIAAPLTKLLRKTASFDWRPEHQRASEEVKKVLTSNPILATFEYSDPSALITDANKSGLAGMSLHRQENDWKIVICCSRRLDRHEENYSISEIECLAIVFALYKLRNYLLGKEFIVITDHCALCALDLRNPKNS